VHGRSGRANLHDRAPFPGGEGNIQFLGSRRPPSRFRFNLLFFDESALKLNDFHGICRWQEFWKSPQLGIRIHLRRIGCVLMRRLCLLPHERDTNFCARLLSIITYVDRVCISTAAGSISSELHLNSAQMGWVFSAFTIAYAIFEIPSGRLGDTLGPRKVLTRIVLWWSAFTMATGLVWSYLSILTARFLFGAGEAGAFPNMSRSLSRWFPERERGTAHGVMFMGSRLGGAVTPLLVTPILAYAGWRTSFWIFGTLGVAWCIFWWRWFRDDPSVHPDVNPAELGLIQESRRDSRNTELPLRYLFQLQLL
jgi:MFS family permease